MRGRLRVVEGLVAVTLVFGCSQKSTPPNGSTPAHGDSASGEETSNQTSRDSDMISSSDLSHSGLLPAAPSTSDESSSPSFPDTTVPSSSGAFPGDPVPPSIRRRPDPATATEQEACVYFFRTQLNRYRFECDGLDPVSEPGPASMLDCPDILFAHGSALTPRSVIECGDVWAQAPCEQLDRSEWPSCGAPPSALPLGSPCRFSRQCASSACSTQAHPDHPACGTCVELAKEGEPCSQTPCESGLECLQGVCKPPPEMALVEGQPCQRVDQCAGRNACLTYSEDVAPTCQPRPGAGESCPARGEYCSGEAFCDDDGMCQADLQAGAACTSNLMCAQGTFCDTSMESPVCVPRGELGAPCRTPESWSTGTCADGGVCVCEPGGSCLEEGGVCIELLRTGDACGGEFQRCDTGSRCENGRCVASGLQGLADGCPPL